jgi:predicted nucleic acid-binding Zn ribbon protein
MDDSVRYIPRWERDRRRADRFIWTLVGIVVLLMLLHGLGAIIAVIFGAFFPS